MPQEGLEEVAQALMQSLEGAGDQREDNWINRIKPFWQNIWPKSLDYISNGIAASLARLCIGARGEFPAALSEVKNWLRPIEHPNHLIHRLHESGLATRFPQDTLTLLDMVLAAPKWVPRDLEPCLSSIAKAAPELKQDPRFVKIENYCRRSHN